jgi:hypothetical protein
MRFPLDRAFRAKIASLAKSAEGLGLTVSETDKGHFLVSDSNKSFKVVAGVVNDEVDVSCECETYANGSLCVHIAYALKRKYNPTTDSFDLPKLEEILDRIVFESEIAEEKGEEKKEEKKEAVKEEKVKEVGSRVQKLIVKEDDEEEIFKMADDLDARQIIISLEGDYSDLELLYEFKDKNGKTHYILSWYGYTKAMLKQGNIKAEFLGFEKVEGRYIAKARAVDQKNNVEVTAIASRIPSFHTEFLFEILAAKSIRNALKRIIDPDVQAWVIRYAKERKLFKEIQIREVATP